MQYFFTDLNPGRHFPNNVILCITANWLAITRAEQIERQRAWQLSPISAASAQGSDDEGDQAGQHLVVRWACSRATIRASRECNSLYTAPARQPGFRADEPGSVHVPCPPPVPQLVSNIALPGEPINHRPNHRRTSFLSALRL
ncbi:hypothetical protein Q1695_012588 [Nippostrongylus brasiliensis]|nr:hypothetical protein Q1695_012588 [Nippostrongylus brasiliensis]